jgi:hypothetical protein
MHESVARIERTISEVKGACCDDCATEAIKVTGHPFWRFVENRYCALKISPIFIKFSPYDKVVKLTNNKIM